MAKAKITFDYNNKTGKREIHIDYQSDPDKLAHEHEREHSRIVRELIGKGIISKDEADDVVIDRPDENRDQEKEPERTYVPQKPKSQLQ